MVTDFRNSPTRRGYGESSGKASPCVTRRPDLRKCGETVNESHGIAVTTYRVSLLNSQGITCGPMFGNRPARWAPTLTAACDRHGAPAPVVDCGCGIYATATLGALTGVVEAATELLAACYRTREAPDIMPEVWVRNTDDGHPILIDPDTTVVVLEGTLHDALPVEAPPFELVPVTRRMLLPLTARIAAAVRADDPRHLDGVVFHGQKDGTEPAGTWRGSRFTAHTVHAVNAQAWLTDLVSPLPVISHPNPRSLTTTPEVNA